MSGTDAAIGGKDSSSNGVALRFDTEKQSKGRQTRGGTKMPTANFRRLQVTLTDRGFARLEKLQELTEAVSQAEVIRDALSFYEAAVEESAAGRQCLFIDPKNPEDRGVRLKLRAP